MLLATALAVVSCSDNDLTVGNTLTQDNDKLEFLSSNFEVQTRTVVVDSILPGSNDCYFGRIKDPETGAYVTSEFMTQLNILETFRLPDQDSIIGREGNMAAADSCVIDFFLDTTQPACSDSLAAMKMRLSELARPAEESYTYFSNYSPKDQGLVREGGLCIDKMFTYADQTIKDSERNNTSSYKSIHIPLNMPYTDRNGETYGNYGTYVMQQYYRHPEYFKNAYHFLHNVCPGFFCEITDGTGFYSLIPEIGIRIYFRENGNDSIYNNVTTLAGTDEVLQVTRISYDGNALQQLAADNTCTYIKSPAGLYTEVTLPVDDIMRGHENDSLIASKISFQRINNSQTDYKAPTTPVNLLLIHKDSLESFFSKNKLNDNVTSFLNSGSTGNTTNTNVSKLNVYAYENISELIVLMANAKRNGMARDPEWTAKHPNWNKVMLVPVTLVQTTASSSYYGSSTTTTGIRHNMSLTSTKLVGGSNNSNEPVMLNVVYSRFK